MNAEAVASFAVGKSPFIGAIISALLGGIVDTTGLIHSGNTTLFVALCGLAGAFFASLPKIIAARSHAKMSESEFVGKETRELVKMLRKQNVNYDSILSLQVAARHNIQGFFQAAVWRINLLEDELERAGLQVIHGKYEPPDINGLLRDLDKQILEIKRTNGNEH